MWALFLEAQRIPFDTINFLYVEAISYVILNKHIINVIQDDFFETRILKRITANQLRVQPYIS